MCLLINTLTPIPKHFPITLRNFSLLAYITAERQNQMITMQVWRVDVMRWKVKPPWEVPTKDLDLNFIIVGEDYNVISNGHKNIYKKKESNQRVKIN